MGAYQAFHWLNCGRLQELDQDIGWLLEVYALATSKDISLGAVATLVKRGSRMLEIGSSVPSRVKPMMCSIDTCRFLDRRLELLR